MPRLFRKVSLSLWPREGPAQARETDGRGERSTSRAAAVLVVDDDHEFVVLMRALLKSMNFTIDSAANGREALDKIAGGSYSVILLDLLIPEIDGFEVIRRISASSPSLLERTIVVTAASDATLRQLHDSRIYGLLRKPFDIDRLRGMIRDCAREIRASSEADAVKLASPFRCATTPVGG